jgi:hypothetical protein
MKRYLSCAIIFLFFLPIFSQKYQSFRVSVYCTADNISQMSNMVKFPQPRWNET